jgi:heptosyltransferase-3
MSVGSIRTVVVIFPGALGDLCLVLPTWRALCRRHAGARLVAVVSEPLRGLVAAARLADATASLDAADASWLFGATRARPWWLADSPAVYAWLGDGDPALRLRLAAAASTLHCLRVERGEGALHAAAAYARALGLADAGAALRADAGIVVAPSPAAEALAAGLTGALLAVHTGAGARAKRWDPAGFVQVSRWWQTHVGAVVEIAGPAEAEAPDLLGAPMARDWSLPDLAALLAHAALYIGNDSGVSHLASAVGTPSVVLYGPTSARRWRPLGAATITLQARGGGPEGIALAALPAARVVAAARRRIALTRGDPDTSVRQ